VNPAFWTLLDELVATSEVVIDRPRGSAHPRFPENIYPYDYGYLEGTISSDGQGIDVWLGSGDTQQLTAVLISADLRKRDAELKLLLGCTRPSSARSVSSVALSEIAAVSRSGPET